MVESLPANEGDTGSSPGLGRSHMPRSSWAREPWTNDWTLHSFLFLILFIYLWLCWVFVFVRGLSLVAASGGHSSSWCPGLSLLRPLLLQSTGSRCAGSVVVAHGPSCSAACGIFPDQGLNPCPLHWQADSQPLRHQGSPVLHSFLWLNNIPLYGYTIFCLSTLQLMDIWVVSTLDYE